MTLKGDIRRMVCRHDDLVKFLLQGFIILVVIDLIMSTLCYGSILYEQDLAPSIIDFLAVFGILGAIIIGLLIAGLIICLIITWLFIVVDRGVDKFCNR